jgi:hypothetical protein
MSMADIVALKKHLSERHLSAEELELAFRLSGEITHRIQVLISSEHIRG